MFGFYKKLFSFVIIIFSNLISHKVFQETKTHASLIYDTISVTVLNTQILFFGNRIASVHRTYPIQYVLRMSTHLSASSKPAKCYCLTDGHQAPHHSSALLIIASDSFNQSGFLRLAITLNTLYAIISNSCELLEVLVIPRI